MDYRIAIPTFRRSETIKEKTLNYLAKTDIDFNKIDLFLSDVTERKAYEKSLSTGEYKKINIVDGVIGIGNQRNFIVDYYPVGQKVFGIDDDIQSAILKIDDKTRFELTELDAFIREAFSATEKAGLNIRGVYPVNNPFFMKYSISFDIKYIVACFYGWINNHEDKAYCTLEDKEDFERSIKYYLADNGVVRFNYVAPKTDYYSESGGMQETRTKQRVKESAEFLAIKYPYLCKLFVSKKGYHEVRLKDTRPIKT